MESSNLKSIPLEVVEMILSHLEVSDLLNFRLVSREWNQECLKQLRKSKGRKSVDSKNIARVLEFLSQSSTNPYAEPWILPFELHTVVSHDINKDPSSTVLAKFGQQVASLIALAPGSVFDTTLKGKCPRREDIFRTWVQILSKCSSHLKRLSIRLWNGSDPIPATTIPISLNLAVDILRHEKLTFPHLKILSTHSSWMRDSRPFAVQESLEHVLIQQSPALEKLEFYDAVYFDQKRWPLVTLPKLKNLSVCQGANSDLIQIIPEPHIIPNLESLRLYPRKEQFAAEHHTQTLRTILSSFSATLKYLTIGNFPRRQDLTNTPLQFPILPSLEHLEVSLQDNGGVPAFADLKEFNFSPANFPALKSIDLELGFCWGTSAASATNLPNWLAFNSVERLTLRIRRSEGCSLNLMQEYMKHVQVVFPKVNRLALINCHSKFEDLRPVFEGIFGSLGAHQIQTFELKDCSGNIWKILMSGEDAAWGALPINNMKNVTKLRLQRIFSYIDESELRWFAEQLPSLNQIEMFVPQMWRNRAKEEQEYLPILAKYPNFVIKVDHHDYCWYNDL